MNKLKNLIRLLTFLLASIGPAGLRAQTATSEPQANGNEQNNIQEQTVEMSPFVVEQGKETGYSANETMVGSRSAKDLLDISGTVTIVDRQMLQDINALSFVQVVAFGAAGVTQFQNFIQDEMIRGFRSQAMRNGVVDAGAEVPLEMYDVERVEIIKGPAAMLLGTNVFLGGTMNYITRVPTATPTGDVVATVNVDEKGKSYDRLVANSLGPLYKSGDMTVNYRLTLGGVTGSGLDKDMESRIEYFAGGGLAMYFGKATSITANFFYYENNSYVYYDDFLDYNAFYNLHYIKLSPYSSTFSFGLKNDAWTREHDGNIDVTLLTKLTANANLRLFFAAFDTSNTSSYVNAYAFASPTVLEREWVPYADTNYDTDLQGDYLYHLALGTSIANDFSAGFDYTTTYNWNGGTEVNLANVNFTAPVDYGGDAAIIAANAPLGFLNPNGYTTDTRVYIFSDYVQDNLTFLNDRINLIAGLRWFYERELAQDANTANDGGKPVTWTDTAPLLTHKYGVVVKPLPWISVYWDTATNQKAQTGFTNPESGPPIPYGNQIGADTEFGLKFRYKVGENLNVYGDVDHFNMSLSNVYETDVTGVLAADGQPVTGVADQTSWGNELELGGRIGAGPGYFDVFGTAYRADTLAAVVGGPRTPAPGVPMQVYSFIGKYTFTGGLAKGFMIGGGAYGSTPRYELNLPIHTPTEVNVFSRYQIDKHWSAQVNIDNVTNKRYVVRIATPAFVEGSFPMEASFVTRFQW